MNKLFVQKFFLMTVGLVVFLFPFSLQAFMSSTNYRLWADDQNSGGGFSSSTNYGLEYSAGQASTPEGTSTNYWLEAGFQSTEEIPILRFQLSKNYIAFGVLENGFVVQDSIVASTTANGVFGYTTGLYQNGPLTTGSANFSAVGDGAVTAGQEEYGIAAAGLDATISGDVAITNSLQTVAAHQGYYASSTYPDARATTVTFKISRGPVTAAGDYNQEVYFISTGNF